MTETAKPIENACLLCKGSGEFERGRSGNGGDGAGPPCPRCHGKRVEPPKTATENQLGQWVPAIPMPLLGPRNKCLACGEKFWTLDGYKGHYALKHILDPRYD